MFLHPDIAKKILAELIEAEENGRPLTLDQALEKWGKGSTWEDLVDERFVLRYPDKVTVTDQGRQWFQNRCTLDGINERTDWAQMIEEVRALISRLRDKPQDLRLGYQLSPGGILNAYTEGDIDFEKAVQELTKQKGDAHK